MRDYTRDVCELVNMTEAKVVDMKKNEQIIYYSLVELCYYKEILESMPEVLERHTDELGLIDRAKRVYRLKIAPNADCLIDKASSYSEYLDVLKKLDARIQGGRGGFNGAMIRAAMKQKKAIFQKHYSLYASIFDLYKI